MRILRLLAALLMLLTLALPAQDKVKKPATESPKHDSHGLILYGDGFTFLASEPEGWDADSGDAARSYQVNLIFFPRERQSREHRTTIRVRLNPKTTEAPAEDMHQDEIEYRKKYPQTKFQKLAIKHPSYTCAAELFYTEGEYYDYVAYLNPGSSEGLMFSVSMGKEKTPASSSELAAFEHVLKSLQMIQASH